MSNNYNWPDRHVAATALLQSQYYPNTRKTRSELPPLFAISGLNECSAKSIIAAGQPQFSPPMTYRSRRFDGLVRFMGMPHPIPYCKLILHLLDNWDSLKPFLDSPNSAVKPTRHKDGRIIVMDYETRWEDIRRSSLGAQGKEYSVSTDLSNCFGSIYSHAIDWALRGKAVAKSNQHSSSWEARIDQLVHNCANKETNGIAIGPAASNIVAELILQRIDCALRPNFPNFIRYIDDYSDFGADRAECESFVSAIESESSKFRLHLNSRKTKITYLKGGLSEDWIYELNKAMPDTRRQIDLVHYLRYAESLAAANLGNSVIKYATTAVFKRLPKKRVRRKEVYIFADLLRISHFHPHIMPTIAGFAYRVTKLLDEDERNYFELVLHDLVSVASSRRESDVIAWGLHAITALGLSSRIPKHLLETMNSLNDDIVWLSMASVSDVGRELVTQRVRSMNSNDVDLVKSHWLIRYELYRISELKENELDRVNEIGWFRAARKSQVRFSKL